MSKIIIIFDGPPGSGKGLLLEEVRRLLTAHHPELSIKRGSKLDLGFKSFEQNLEVEIN